MATHPVEVNPKSVLELWREQNMEWREMHDRHNREMRAAILAEFPIGTKVRWKHSENYIEGVVVEYKQYNDSEVIVQNSKSKSKRDIEAYRLERVI